MKAFAISVASVLMAAGAGAGAQHSSWQESMVSQQSEPATATPSKNPILATDKWLVSETTSPLDYTPVAIATTSAGDTGNPLRLSIQCRGGKTDLVISSTAMTRRVEEYALSYRVNGSAPVALVAVATPSGSGVAIRDDVVRLLAKLPDSGEISIAIATREGSLLEGRYDLAALSAVRARLAVPCKWALAAPK